MCLEINEDRTKDFWITGPGAGKTEIIAQKVYQVDMSNDAELFLFSPYFTIKVKPGKIVSNREGKEFGEDPLDCYIEDIIFSSDETFIKRQIIKRGIHVVLDKGELRSWILDIQNHVICRNPIVVVDVICKKEDFVACDSDGNAVFTEVYISEEEYKRALREKADEIRDKIAQKVE